MALTLLVVAVYVCIVVMTAYFSARLAARALPRLRVPRAAAALVLAGLALTPVPVHGGLDFLLPMLLHDARGDLRSFFRRHKAERKQVRLESRFAGFLPPSAVGTGWRDEASGLVWSREVGAVAAIDSASLAKAGAICRSLEPSGYWALPRDAEFYFLAKTGKAEGRWLAEALLLPEELSLAKLVVLGPPQVGGKDFGQSGPTREAQVRCVAVTPPAPLRGYLSSDIPLRDWNRYQLGLNR